VCLHPTAALKPSHPKTQRPKRPNSPFQNPSKSVCLHPTRALKNQHPSTQIFSPSYPSKSVQSVCLHPTRALKTNALNTQIRPSYPSKSVQSVCLHPTRALKPTHPSTQRPKRPNSPFLSFQICAICVPTPN
jgi:hypothetical protein